MALVDGNGDLDYNSKICVTDRGIEDGPSAGLCCHKAGF